MGKPSFLSDVPQNSPTFPLQSVHFHLNPCNPCYPAAVGEKANYYLHLVDNHGGSPDGAMLLAGYAFARPTLMARIYSRLTDSTTEMWTLEVPQNCFVDKEIYILTSHSTFSAAEAFAYHMKYVRHAVTVGEATGGGAHRIQPVHVGKGFVLLLPCTRPINVVTGKDWEGTGVQPEIESSATQARATAHLAALRKLPSNEQRLQVIDKLERELGKAK